MLKPQEKYKGKPVVLWNDGLGHRGRRVYLFLRKGEGEEATLRQFGGRSIPRWCAVIEERFKKNGKWSNTTYRIALSSDVSAFSIREGWETGTFQEATGAASWEEAAEYLGTSIEEVKRFLRTVWPSAAERFDKVEEALDLLD